VSSLSLRRLHAILGLLCFTHLIYGVGRLDAQTLAGVELPPGGKFSVIEKADLRRYENGAFVGLEYREVRGILEWQKASAGQLVQGTFSVLEELDHDGTHTARKIDATVPVSYTIRADGSYAVEGNAGYPTLRGFPVLPSEGLSAGDGWRAYGVRLVDPLKGGTFSRVKFYCDYRYEGEKEIGGQAVRLISAKYAMRYKKGDDPAGDERLESVSGSHSVSIQLAAVSGRLSFMRDLVEETYALSDGASVTYKGFILTWFDAAAPLDRGKVAEDISAELRKSGAADVEVTQKEEGVSVSLNKIHFVAEQAVVLPDERSRLESLGEALKRIPGRTFRVIGHTARVGTEQSQYELSVKRAKAIVDFLVSRGIPAERFLYEGRGGSEPVAPNDSEENMARNRRVEIVILED
jgi:OOP family OmpA-OmpF porin